MNFIPDDSLGHLLTVVAGKFNNEFHQLIAPYGITVEQSVVLFRLLDGDSKTQKQLADETTKDEPNMTRILKKLDDKGLIFKQPDRKDKRVTLILLTPAGSQLKEQLLPFLDEMEQRRERYISKEENEFLKSILLRLKNHM